MVSKQSQTVQMSESSWSCGSVRQIHQPVSYSCRSEMRRKRRYIITVCKDINLSNLSCSWGWIDHWKRKQCWRCFSTNVCACLHCFETVSPSGHKMCVYEKQAAVWMLRHDCFILFHYIYILIAVYALFIILTVVSTEVTSQTEQWKCQTRIHIKKQEEIPS